MHVAEYLVEAGLVLACEEKKPIWGMEHKRRMLAGEFDHVLADLKAHTCGPTCAKNDSVKCLVRVAEGYLENHREYMDQYVEFMIANLPVGSGEAESGIRHVIKRRMLVAGAWAEKNAGLMLALLSIRASGWWDDFWQWRTERDREAWHERQAGATKILFRNKRTENAEPAKAAA